MLSSYSATIVFFGLNVGALFSEAEAALALSYAKLGQFVCNVVRGYVYRVASSLN